MAEEKVLIRRPQTHKMMSALVNQYWQEIMDVHKEGRLLAFVSSFPAIEMMNAMGIRLVQDENYGAYLTARRGMGGSEAIAQVNKDFSPDLCSYCKAADGAFLYPDLEIAGRIPQPDFLAVYPLCGSQFKEMQDFQRKFNVPAFYFDIPIYHHHSLEEMQARLPYIVKQLYDFVEFLEDITHRPFNWEGLKQAMAYDKRIGQLRAEGVHLAKHIPSPETWFDGLINVFCGNVMRGRPESIPYLEAFNAEMRERVAQGIGALPDEKYRLVWDFNIMFPKIRWVSELFASHNASIVSGAWLNNPHTYRWELVNPEEPILSLATEMLTCVTVYGLDWNIEYDARLAREYAADGIVLMMARTCRLVSISLANMEWILRERTGLPVLNFEGDTGDETLWNDAAIKTRVEAFLEVVATSKEERSKNRSRLY